MGRDPWRHDLAPRCTKTLQPRRMRPDPPEAAKSMHSLTMRSTGISERHGSIADYADVAGNAVAAASVASAALEGEGNDETQHVVAIE